MLEQKANTQIVLTNRGFEDEISVLVLEVVGDIPMGVEFECLPDNLIGEFLWQDSLDLSGSVDRIAEYFLDEGIVNRGARFFGSLFGGVFR